MKIVVISLMLLMALNLTWSQEQITQDPKAGQILERVAQKFKTLTTLQADYDLIIEDRKEHAKNSSAGKLIMKQKKFKVMSEGTTLFFDGITMWTYVSDHNEVTVTEPRNNPGDFMSNPSSFFASYKSEFKYRYVDEVIKSGISCHEIDLFPKNLNQPYSRIKVFIDGKSDLPQIISSIGKDGVDYTVYLKNSIINRDIPDATFTFDASKYKKVEIIDMRGL